jgi:superfamily I DNA and/or RNA helicase
LVAGDLERWSAVFGTASAALIEARQSAAKSLTSEATVFLCTVDALSRVCKLQCKKQKILIIDEAGTVPEYKLPLAVSLGVEAVIAVGDQNQLKPFTHTGMSNGFFHRLAKTVSPSMLEEQFRMHPQIGQLVSSSFYNNRLFTNPAVASVRCSVPFSGVHWADYSDPHAESHKSGAVCNRVELEMIRGFMSECVTALLFEGRSVMLITFYREQFHLLMLLGEKLGLVGTRLQGTKTERFFIHPGFRISTVDASQGSESDIVIISCVRCNPRHEIGFLSQPNRVCVALSRARERLVIVGSSQTLLKGSVWVELFSVANKTSEISSSFQTQGAECGGGSGVSVGAESGLVEIALGRETLVVDEE